MIERAVNLPNNVAQNLRLLKSKIRLGSATSHASEPYVNVTVKNPQKVDTQSSEGIFRNSAGNIANSSYEDSAFVSFELILESTTQK
jgi:hypothetical protein